MSTLDLQGLDGYGKKIIPALLFKDLKQLRENWKNNNFVAHTAAEQNGAINIWITKDKIFCERQVYFFVEDQFSMKLKDFRDFSQLEDWVIKNLREIQ